MEARFNEIIRCKSIKSLLKADLIRKTKPGEELMSEEELLEKIMNSKECENEQRDIRIEVADYDELIKLLEPWPFDSFGSGVKPYLCPIKELPITILSVELGVFVNEDSVLAQQIEKRYGLVEIERNYARGLLSNPMKSMKAYPLTIQNYIEAIQSGVPINPMVRKCGPTINYARICNKCLTLKHSRCAEEATQLCVNCGLSGHTTDKCKETSRCVNCKRGHRSDSEECSLLRRKTFLQNDYAISILLGERIILNENAILRDPDSAVRSENSCSKDEVREMVEELISKNETIISMNERLVHQENETKLIKLELGNLATQVTALDTKLDDTKTVLGAQITESRDEMRQALAVGSLKHDETNGKLGEILEGLKNMGKTKTQRKQE